MDHLTIRFSLGTNRNFTQEMASIGQLLLLLQQQKDNTASKIKITISELT